MPEIQLLDLAGVRRITTLSPSSILRLRHAGDFPQPVQVLKKNMFVKEEILEWALARVAARPARPRTVIVNAKGSAVQPSAR